MSAFVIRNTGTGILPFSCYSASKIMYLYLNDTATCKTGVEKQTNKQKKKVFGKSDMIKLKVFSSTVSKYLIFRFLKSFNRLFSCG